MTNASNATTLTPFDYAMGNLSYMFGWQLAGAALSQDELDVGCNNIDNIAHGRWAQEGLVEANIHDPLCNASHSNPNATTALPHIVSYGTELFTTYILSAFASNDTASYAYLCKNLRNLLLDGFHLNDIRVISATCQAAGLQTPPQLEDPISTINADATQAYANTASILYALMFASGPDAQIQLNVYCAHAPEYIINLNEELLNGTLVGATICDITQPIDISQGANYIRTWISRMFITAIENVSNVDGWLSWLCNNMSVDSMNGAGLDGQVVITEVCDDARD